MSLQAAGLIILFTTKVLFKLESKQRIVATLASPGAGTTSVIRRGENDSDAEQSAQKQA